jgi:hypothetical protein
MAVNLTLAAGAATQASATVTAPAVQFLTPRATAATSAVAAPSTPVTGNGLPQSIDPLAVFNPVNVPALEPPDLLGMVPPFERSSYEIQAVLGVVANELSRIEAAQGALTANFFPGSADALLPIFETLLGLPVRPPGLDITTRQGIVLAYMQRLKSAGRGLDWINALAALAGASFTYQEHLTNPPTNLIPNPSFDYDTTGAAPAAWSTIGALGSNLNSGATATVVASGAYRGAKCCQVVTTTAQAAEGISLPVLAANAYSPGQQYSASMWLKGSAGGEALSLLLGNTAYYAGAQTNVTLTTSWQRVTAVFTAPSGSGAQPISITARTQGAVACTFFADAACVVAGATPADFDGDTPTYQWSGTPGNSTSFLSSPPANTVLVKIPSALAGVGWPYIRDITPAHIAINQGYTDGFFVGITNIGSNL